MTAPYVNELPQSPSRLGRPSNFVTESTLFLDSLLNYRREINEYSSYINKTIPNKQNFGSVIGRRNFPDINQALVNIPDQSEGGLKLTGDIETLYDALKLYSSQVVNAGLWFTSVANEHGVAPYDLHKPMVSGVTPPMTRKQSRVEFNNTAEMFSETVLDNINSLYLAMFHTYISCCANTDCGYVTDTTIIEVLDAGKVSDKNLEYT